MSYEVELSIFITLACLCGAFFAYLFIRPLIKYFPYTPNVRRCYYKAVRRLADENDLLLVNQFRYVATSGSFGIDHILLGNKYIYLIRDRYWKGAISAKIEDASWIYFDSRHSSQTIPNALIMNSERRDRLASSTGVDPAIFVSIVVYNDDCLFPKLDTYSESDYIVSISELPKLIRELESRKIGDLDSKSIDMLAKRLAEIKESGKKTSGKK